MVDWSSLGRPSPVRESKDAIWTACWINGKSYPPRYHRTRLAVFDYLTEKMKNEKRLLIGFDFPFGYPYDSYNEFGRSDWKDLWKLISTNIKDDIDNCKNKNNRFDVANKLNSLFAGEGPFWGHHFSPNNFLHLKQKPTLQDYDNKLPSKFRHIEKILGNQHGINPSPVWGLFGQGSVGSQSLVGIPKVNKLHNESNCVVWPFENIDDENKHVIAEIYPSIWDIQGDHDINDANQVYTVAKNIAYLDENKLLQKFLNAPFDYERDNKINEGDIIKKEGWILGVDKNGRPAKCH